MSEETNEAVEAIEIKTEIVEAPKRGRPKKEDADLFPVLILRNYRPVGKFKIDRATLENPMAGWDEPTGEEKAKVRAGNKILMDRDEARSIIGKGIAERADDI